MRKFIYKISIIFCLLTISSLVKAQDLKNLNWVYDVNFLYDFDNREFDKSNNEFINSMTIHCATLTPSVGLQYKANNSLNHRLMLGIDIGKNMGEHPIGDNDKSLNNWDLFQEIIMYYSLDKTYNNSKLNFMAGVIPNRFKEGDYGPEFMSDSLKIADNNMEGILLKYRKEKIYIEGGLDWNGMFGSHRRERFTIFSYAQFQLLPYMNLGYQYIGHHFANTLEYGGVVDNNLLEPYIELSKHNKHITNTLTISYLQAIQQDRHNDTGIECPNGFKTKYDFRYKALELNASCYYGKSLMPYYNTIDAGGNKYGNDLYWGDPSYRINLDDNNKRGAYSFIGAFWKPRLSNLLSLDIGFIFHFNSPEGFNNWEFTGWRQKISLVFNIENFNKKK